MRKKLTAFGMVLIVCALFMTGCHVNFGSDWFYYPDLAADEPSHSKEPRETKDPSRTEDATEKPNVSYPVPTFRTEDGGETFTVSEVYADNVNCVVGITSEATSKNIFGQTTSTASTGTGIVLSENGYILTNYHVVDGANTLRVTAYDGTVYTAEIVGAEKSNDVAVLKIDAEGLRAVVLGNSDGIAVGEDVLVIGNPLGELTYTLTRGVVSALNRVINTDGTPINMFQIDAAVNAGNSGGPAFDARGHVIGMVTAKVSSSNVEGLGFCIPINDAISIAEQLIEFGYVKGKGALEIGVTEAYSRSFWGTSRVSGAYVSFVIEGGVGDQAGIETGMLINYVDSTTVTSPEDLATVLRTYKAGNTVTLRGVRDGKSFELQVILSEYSPEIIPDGWNPSNGTIV